MLFAISSRAPKEFKTMDLQDNLLSINGLLCDVQCPLIAADYTTSYRLAVRYCLRPRPVDGLMFGSFSGSETLENNVICKSHMSRDM